MKHVRLLVLTALTLSLLAACSQNQPSDELQTPGLEPQFGTRGFDSVEDVAYSKAGMLYTVGLWDQGNDIRGNSNIPLAGEAYLRRYDRSGNLIWETYFDLEPEYQNRYPHQLISQTVATDNSGNAIVAWTAVYHEEYSTVASFNYLSKLAPNGNRLWRVNTNNDQIKDLTVDSSGNMYAITGGGDVGKLIKYSAGGTKSWERATASRNSAPAGVTVSSSNNVYLVRNNGIIEKYNSSGTLIWSKATAAARDYIQNYKIASGLNDELFITGGYLYRHELNDSCDGSSGSLYYYARLYKFSGSGVPQWFRNTTKTYAYENGCSGDIDGWEPRDGLNLALDTLGNVYVVGGEGKSEVSGDAFVIKYNRSGSQLWSQRFSSGAPLDGATSIATYDGSEIYVGAVTYGSLVHRNLGGSDAVLRKMDKNGNRVWTR